MLAWIHAHPPDAIVTSRASLHTPTDTVRAFISAFVEAWPTGDATGLALLFSDDAVYHNMPFEPAIGRVAIVATLESFMALGGQVSVDILHLAADGPIVMTERVDKVIREDGTFSLRVMGACEIGDGLITAWRDYFDPSEFST